MYEIVVGGRVERTVRVALEDLVDEWREQPGMVVLRVTDQARLVALINRVHELGLSVEQARRSDP